MAYCDYDYGSKTKACTKNVDASVNVALIGAGTELAEKKISYLAGRLQTIRSKHQQDLHKAYYDDKAPKTIKEALERIAKGEYKLDEKRVKHIEEAAEDYEDGDGWWFTWSDGIIWNINRPDRKVYDAALEQIEKDYTEAYEDISVLDPVEGLKAVRAFAAKTYALA